MSDISELVKRLREPERPLNADRWEAASVLEAQAKEIERLRAALETIAEEHDAGRHDGLPEPCPVHDADTMFAIAKKALEEK